MKELKEIKILGGAQAATFAGVEIVNGYSKKVFVDDMAVNKELSAPADLKEVMLVGGVDIEVMMEANYSPQKIGDDRVRTCRIDISTRAKPMGPTVPISRPTADLLTPISCPDEEARINSVKIDEALAIANAANAKAEKAEAKADEATAKSSVIEKNEGENEIEVIRKEISFVSGKADSAKKVAEEAKSTADMAIDISSKATDVVVGVTDRVKKLEDRPQTNITEEERGLLNRLPSIFRGFAGLPWWVQLITFVTGIVISIAIAVALDKL